MREAGVDSWPMWKILQISIFLGVMFANIYWQVTPNGYLASAAAVGCAYVVTVALSWLLSIPAWNKQRRALLRQQHGHHGLPPGWR